MKLRWVAFWAMVVLAAAMLVTSVLNEFRRQRRMDELMEEKVEALRQAQDKLSRLRDRVEFFKTEEGQAWIARDKLNMAFSGEEIYKIEGDLPDEKTPRSERPVQESRPGAR